MLFSLSCVVNRCKLDVRTRGLTVLFEIVKNYGEAYKANWWKDLFNVLFRIFDNMKLPEQFTEKAEWMTTTCNHALYAIVDVFTQYFDVLGPLLLSNLYTQLHWCVQQNNEQLARSGTNCLENLVISNGLKFSADTWDKTCKCMFDIFNSTLPRELLTWKPSSETTTAATPTTDHPSTSSSMIAGPPLQPHTANGGIRHSSSGNVHSILKRSNSQHSVYSLHGDESNSIYASHNSLFANLLIKCVVQLELIQTIDSIVFFPTTSRKEDAETLALATADITGSNTTNPNECQREEQGMYGYLDTPHLLQLVDCLLESHRFAKRFNSDHEQRNVLLRAGLKGDVKPNLLNQETMSLACVLRILFKMYSDDSRSRDWPDIEARLIVVCKEAFEYFLTLQNGTHREAWTSLLLLVLTRLIKMQDQRVSKHIIWSHRKSSF